MQIDSFLLSVNDQDTLKVSIWEDIINNKKVYHAKYININLDFYKNLSRLEQETFFGIEYREENNGPIIYYFDKDLFIKDLKMTMITDSRLKNQLKS